jgi:hypothetical protein
MKLISQKKAMEITGLSRYDIDCLAKAGRLNYFKLPVGSSTNPRRSSRRWFADEIEALVKGMKEGVYK